VRRVSAEQELARLEAEQSLIERAEQETAFLTEYCAQVRSNLHRVTTTEEKQRTLEALNIIAVWYPEKRPKICGSIDMRFVTNAG
jgi:hypothetical protein